MSPTRSSTSRFASVSAIVVLLVLTVTVAIKASWPSAVGGGATAGITVSTIVYPAFKFAFSALEGPSSARGDYGSFGHARIDLASGRMEGPVVCVTVDPLSPQAWFVFEYTAGADTRRTRVYVKDGGDSAAQGGDLIGWEVAPVTGSCIQNTQDLTLHPTDSLSIPPNTQPVVKGNITIDVE